MVEPTKASTYNQTAVHQAERLRQSGQATLLAIESSCDETAAAVVRNGRDVLSNVIWSQIDTHQLYGGVVPEIASRLHAEKIERVLAQALQKAGKEWADIDAVAVTNGPGLVGCLLVGVSFGKALALAQGLPLVAVHHIQGHIAANYIAEPTLSPPFVCLVVSGGHSHIYAVESPTHSRLLGCTRDDAAGEAFDKAARALGLTYPGGPALETLAQKGDPNAFAFHSAFNEAEHLDLSFSGMKTALLNHLHNAEQRGESLNRADLAASFQQALIDVLVQKSIRACRMAGMDTLALAGGVAANKTLRNALKTHCEAAGLRFVCPPLPLCTDNAAMIGAAGFYALMAGERAGLDLNAVPGRRLI